MNKLKSTINQIFDSQRDNILLRDSGLVFAGGKAVEAVQACFDLNPDNLDREINGLVEALKVLKLKKGRIVTLNQRDRHEKAM